jgi:predicted O-methyltransferase YrrM
MRVPAMRPKEYLKNGLISVCDYVNSKTKVEKALEVGSYLGESTIIFANNFPAIEEIIAVDPFSLSYNSDNLFDENAVLEIYEKFLNNISLYPKIKHLKMSSEEASRISPDKYYDFIYIDGCHQYNSVVNDIQYWLPKVKKGGFISFHDVDSVQVNSAISNFFNIDTGFITEDTSITFEV